MQQTPTLSDAVIISYERSMLLALEQIDIAVSAVRTAGQTLSSAGVSQVGEATLHATQLNLVGLQTWVSTELERASELALEDMPNQTTAELPSRRLPAPVHAPSVETAVELLFGSTKVAGLETEFGQVILVRMLELNGCRLTATAPSLALRDGARLAARLIGPDSKPWRLEFVCRGALEQHGEALVALDVVDVSGDDGRHGERRKIEVAVTLRAVACADLHEGAEVRGFIVNLSKRGMGFTATDSLRLGDRLQFHARFMEGAIDGEAEVASLQTLSGATIFGCRFTSVEPGPQRVIDAAVGRSAAVPRSISYSGVRALFHEEPPQQPSRRFSRPRRG
jgi:PilZ domain